MKLTYTVNLMDGGDTVEGMPLEFRIAALLEDHAKRLRAEVWRGGQVASSTTGLEAVQLQWTKPLEGVGHAN